MVLGKGQLTPAPAPVRSVREFSAQLTVLLLLIDEMHSLESLAERKQLRLLQQTLLFVVTLNSSGAIQYSRVIRWTAVRSTSLRDLLSSVPRGS